jgi:hypothetical protein
MLFLFLKVFDNSIQSIPGENNEVQFSILSNQEMNLKNDYISLTRIFRSGGTL